MGPLTSTAPTCGIDIGDRPYAPNQPYLLPPSPSEWLPEGHLAYFILDLVEDLDLGDIDRVLQAKAPPGRASVLTSDDDGVVAAKPARCRLQPM